MDYTTNLIKNGLGLGVLEQYATVPTMLGIVFGIVIILILLGVFDPPRS
tara:strand:+ start:74 stop:220 length:147 start_codon:yes stop_codon:yes gene_type:complete